LICNSIKSRTFQGARNRSWRNRSWRNAGVNILNIWWYSLINECGLCSKPFHKRSGPSLCIPLRPCSILIRWIFDAKPAEQLGKRGTTPEPITAQASTWAIGQARRVQRILQHFEAGAFSRQHGDGSSSLASSTDIVLKILADEFSANNPEDGRYTPQQRMQGSESSPAMTGEFNCTLNMAVHEVDQPHADKETSLAYARHRAAQERLS